jgi:hypothetical protein
MKTMSPRAARRATASLSAPTWWVDPENDQPIEVSAPLLAASRPRAVHDSGAFDPPPQTSRGVTSSLTPPRLRALRRYRRQRRPEINPMVTLPKACELVVPSSSGAAPIFALPKASKLVVPSSSGTASLPGEASTAEVENPGHHFDALSTARIPPDRIARIPQAQVLQKARSSRPGRAGSVAVLLLASSFVLGMSSTLQSEPPAPHGNQASLEQPQQPGRPGVEPPLSQPSQPAAEPLQSGSLRRVGEVRAKIPGYVDIEHTDGPLLKVGPSAPSRGTTGTSAAVTELSPLSANLDPQSFLEAGPAFPVVRHTDQQAQGQAKPSKVIATRGPSPLESSPSSSQSSIEAAIARSSAAKAPKLTPTATNVRESPSATITRERSPESRGPVRISVHYSTLSRPNRGWAERVASRLSRSGYEVVSVTGHASEIGRSSVHFFHPDDRQISQSLTSIVETTMGQFGGPTRVRNASPRSSARQSGVLEIWLAGGLGS